MSENKAFGWDSTIDSSNTNEQEFILLPDGNYDFRITTVTKKQFNGSAKMPACPQANIRIEIIDPASKEKVAVFSNLFLCSSQEWKLIQFFRCIGVMEPAEKTLKMRWDIEGEAGTCKITHRTYNGKTYNDVAEWIKPELPF